MDFQHLEQQTLQVDETYSRYLIIAIRKIILFLQILIPLITNLSANYPHVFIALITLFLVYTSVKIIKNFAKILKRLLFLYLLVLLLSVYLRGIDQFVNYDVPFIYRSVITSDNSHHIVKHIWRFFKTQFDFYTKFLYEYFSISNSDTFTHTLHNES